MYGLDDVRLSVTVKGVENGAGHIIENGDEIRLYYHQDLRGTVDYLTSPVSGKVESWTHYNEWGEITHNAVLKCGQRELDMVKNYTGHEYDSVLGMYYAKARFYDAGNRRFISMDPVKGTPYDPAQYIQYLYVKNGPLTKIDPNGQLGLTFTVLLAAGATTLVIAGSVMVFKGLQEFCTAAAEMVYPHLANGAQRIMEDIDRGVRTFETIFESTAEFNEYARTLSSIQASGTFDRATVKSYVPSTSALEREVLDTLGVGANTVERRELQNVIQSIKNSAYDYLVSVVDGSAIVSYAGTEDYKEYFTQVRCDVQAKIAARANQKLERGYCVYVLTIPPNSDVVYVGMTIDPERRLAAHNSSGKFGEKRVDLTIITKAKDKNDARVKEMFYMTVYFDELYEAAYNRVRSISPGKMGADKYKDSVRVLAEMVGNITENELLCMLEETVPPGFGH